MQPRACRLMVRESENCCHFIEGWLTSVRLNSGGWDLGSATTAHPGNRRPCGRHTHSICGQNIHSPSRAVDASMRRTKNPNQGCALYCRSGACLFVYVSVCAWVSIWMNFSGGQTRARDDDAVPGKDWGPSVSQPDDDGWHDRWMDFGDQSDVMSGTQRKRES